MHHATDRQELNMVSMGDMECMLQDFNHKAYCVILHIGPSYHRRHPYIHRTQTDNNSYDKWFHQWRTGKTTVLVLQTALIW